MTEEEIIYGINKNDSNIYKFLIDEYSKLMWYVASGILKNLGSSEDIEDVIAESFARLWENPEKFDPKRGNVKSYLCLLAKSIALDKVRKINKISTIDISDTNIMSKDNLEDKIIAKNDVREIYEHVKSFKEPDCEIFLLRYFYQLNPTEISEKLSITVKEVSNRLYNSKKRLIDLMKIY